MGTLPPLPVPHGSAPSSATSRERDEGAWEDSQAPGLLVSASPQGTRPWKELGRENCKGEAETDWSGCGSCSENGVSCPDREKRGVKSWVTLVAMSPVLVPRPTGLRTRSLGRAKEGGASPSAPAGFWGLPLPGSCDRAPARAGPRGPCCGCLPGEPGPLPPVPVRRSSPRPTPLPGRAGALGTEFSRAAPTLKDLLGLKKKPHK